MTVTYFVILQNLENTTFSSNVIQIISKSPSEIGKIKTIGKTNTFSTQKECLYSLVEVSKKIKGDKKVVTNVFGINGATVVSLTDNKDIYTMIAEYKSFYHKIQSSEALQKPTTNGFLDTPKITNSGFSHVIDYERCKPLTWSLLLCLYLNKNNIFYLLKEMKK